jgi:hypothetical protein
MDISQTGGLRYHLRAMRYAGGLWRPYLAAVRAWLDAWRAPERALVLIGPSAGYSLHAGFLTRFQSVTAVDPDGVAAWLFRRRLGAALARAGTSLRWVREDYLSPGPAGFDIARLANWLDAEHPGAAVLFANVLGQLYLLASERDADSFVRWKRALPEALGARSYASYHDRLSGALRPRIPADWTPPAVPTDDALAEVLYADALREHAEAGGAEAELEQHGTADLFPGMPRSYFAWEIAPGRHHLIEAVCRIQ